MWMRMKKNNELELIHMQMYVNYIAKLIRRHILSKSDISWHNWDEKDSEISTKRNNISPDFVESHWVNTNYGWEELWIQSVLCLSALSRLFRIKKLNYVKVENKKRTHAEVNVVQVKDNILISHDRSRIIERYSMTRLVGWSIWSVKWRGARTHTNMHLTIYYYLQNIHELVNVWFFEESWA